jgi:hypothetical protein
MNRVAVASSNVRAVGYDPASETLEVEFHNGNVYQYAPVTPEQHAELLGSESIGRAVNTTFKANPAFRCTRVYPCCSEPFDSTAIRHVCAVMEVR